MSSSVIENIVAQENINPKHAQQVVENADAYKDTTAQEQALFDQNINSQKENHDLSNMPGWNMWISNPYRASEFGTADTEKLRGLYELSKQPLYESLAQKYGHSLAYKTDIILGHTRQTGWAPYRAYSAITNNLNQMRVSDYENRLSKARTEGNTEAIAELEEKLAQYKYRAAYGPQSYESESWNTAAAFVASTIRNPEVLVLSALAGAATVFGAPVLAAAGASAGVAAGASIATAGALKTTALADIYSDTKNLTMGQLLPEIMKENPNITEEEARKIAEDPAMFSGIVEVFTSALGMSVRGGAMVGSSRAATGLLSKMGIQKSGTEAIKSMPEFARKYLRSQTPKTFAQYAKEAGGETLGNTLEEFLQQAAEETAVIQTKTGQSFSEAYANRLIDFIANPEDPKNAELLKTIKNTLFGAGVISGAMGTPGALRTLNKKTTMLERSNQATNNMSFAQQLFDWRQKNKVAKESPETDSAHSQILVDKGIAPKKVRIDRKTAMEVLKDPNMAEAVKELELEAAVAESEENGGVVEVDFAKYDSVVNSNKELFQKVSSGVSFIENSLTVNEFIDHLNSLDMEALSEIKKAQDATDSVYNQVYKQQMQIDGMSENVARVNAITAQLMTNRIGAFRLGKQYSGEQVFNEIEIRTTNDEQRLLDAANTAEQQKPAKAKGQGRLNALRDVLALRGFNVSGVKSAGANSHSVDIINKDGKTIATVSIGKASRKGKEGEVALSSTGSIYDNLAQIEESIGTRGDVVMGNMRIDSGKAIIHLTANANPTTLTHELFHVFSNAMQKAFNAGEMTEYWAKQVKNLAKTVGAEIKDGKLVLTDEQEEKAANMFMLYIKEGKIQNREIAPLFAFVQDMFRKVCAFLKINGKLSKSADELFDSIFRAQDLIEHEQRMAGLLPIEKPEGADQELYDMYVGEMLTSRMKATQDLVRKRERMKKFVASKQYESLRETVKAAITKDFSNRIEYRIKEIAAENNNDPLQTFMAIQENPELSRLDLPVEQIQDILNNTPELSKAVEQETEKQMLSTLQQEYNLTAEEIGYDETRNTAKVRALLAEALMRGGKTAKDFDAEYKKILDMADRQINKTEIRKLKKDAYWVGLETKIVEDYIVALGKNNNNAMARARRDQAVVNAIRIRAKAMSNRFDRFIETARKFEGAQQKVVHKNEKGKSVSEFKYTAEAYDLMQSILEKFGFYVKYAHRSPKPVAEKLLDWVENQEATTMTKLGALKNYIGFINEGYAGEADRMTGGQFDKLSIVFDAVKAVSGGEYSVLIKSEQVFFSDLVNATRDNFQKKGLEAFQKPDNWWTKNFGIVGKWTNPEAVLRAIFPAEVMDNIFLPFIDAAVRAEKAGNEWVNRFREAKSKVDLSNTLHTYSTGHTLSNKEVADLLLSMGNQHAYDNFRISLRNLTEQEAETIVSEAIQAQPELANFAKEVWATYDKAREYLETEFETRTNTLFVRKEHRSFTINGIEFGGGYVPARKSYDFIPSDPRAKNVGGMVHDKKFEKNIYAEADGNVLSIVDITENELYQSAKQGITAVEYNNAQKFLKQDGVKDIIGNGAFDFIQDWLTVYQAPYVDTSAWIRPLAQLSTTAALGFRASTMILQLSGLFQAAIELGPSYFARGIAQAMRNGEWAPKLATTRGADKSDYMSARINDPRSSLLGRSVVDAVRMQDAKTQAGKVAQAFTGKAGDYAMAGIQYFDTIVANVTWNGAYKRALDMGKSEEEARRDADSVVRVVQSDAMQISRPTVMQSQLARTVTAFSTWILAMRSQLAALTGTKQYGSAFVWAVAYMVISPLFESFLKEATNMIYGDDDDDKEYLDKVLNTWYNQMVDTVGAAFIPAANLGAGAAKAIASGIELGFTDENEIFKLYQSNVPALQTAGRMMTAGRYGIAGAISGDSEKLKKAAIQASTSLSSEGGKIVKMLLAD